MQYSYRKAYQEFYMRILFDSRKKEFKEPFGALVPGQVCTLRIRIPAAVQATAVSCHFLREDGKPFMEVAFTNDGVAGDYTHWAGQFSIEEPGLFFYHFSILSTTGSFRLFKQGDETNMEAGDCWQLTCTPADFTTPDWAKGATIYQLFPDRFHRAGVCDLTGKLRPWVLHENWDEEVFWQPTEKGEVLNNDFYGGNFKGITEKLPYIASLGTTILYLNPICKSYSSHRYDTGDYKTPDPMLGTLEEFRLLCDTAHKLGIRVVFDAVFSHTGSDSLYFDRAGTFGGNGAYCTKNSPYYSWYTFHSYPNSYNCWWNFDTLPTVNKLDPAFLDYIIENEDSVVAHWIRMGVDGFRLDVADELPNEFMARLKRRVRQLKPDALVLGEVWEDASNKIAYGVRRRYFTDGTLDSVMNYPFRNAILNFTGYKDHGTAFRNTVLTIMENYPKQVLDCNMNLLGTHDTPRILTALVDPFDGPREAMAGRRLNPEQRKKAQQLLKLASVLQYTLPGSPSLYYGDEAGMEGGKDPFNRRTYPWGKEDLPLLAHFRKLGSLRKEHPALRLGHLEFFCANNGKIGYSKTLDGHTFRIYVNRTTSPWVIGTGRLCMGPDTSYTEKGLSIAPMSFCITEDL